MRLARAYSRHISVLGQVLQIRRARSTPTPSLGKKVAGGWFRQFPSAIHAVSVSSCIVSPRLSALHEALNRPLRFPTEKSVDPGNWTLRPSVRFPENPDIVPPEPTDDQ